MEKHRCHVVIDKETHKLSKIQAMKEDSNFSELVEKLLREYLDKQKREG